MKFKRSEFILFLSIFEPCLLFSVFYSFPAFHRPPLRQFVKAFSNPTFQSYLYYEGIDLPPLTTKIADFSPVNRTWTPIFLRSQMATDLKVGSPKFGMPYISSAFLDISTKNGGKSSQKWLRLPRPGQNGPPPPLTYLLAPSLS